MNGLKIFTKCQVYVAYFGHNIGISRDSHCLVMNAKNVDTLACVLALSLNFSLSLFLTLLPSVTLSPFSLFNYDFFFLFLPLSFLLSFDSSVTLPFTSSVSLPSSHAFIKLLKVPIYTRHCARKSCHFCSMTSHSTVFISLILFFNLNLLNLL